MTKSRLIWLLAIVAIAVPRALAQSPDSTWCTPTSVCSQYFSGSNTGNQGGIVIPAAATIIGAQIAPDNITGSGTVSLQTAPCSGFSNNQCTGAGSYTTCASATLNTTPTAPVTLTCAAATTTGGWYAMQVNFGTGITGTYHGRLYAALPSLTAINIPTAQCLATPAGSLTRPCVAYSGSFGNFCTAYPSGTPLNVTLTPPGNETFIVSPNFAVTTAGSAGTAVASFSWTAPQGAAYGGLWLVSQTLANTTSYQSAAGGMIAVKGGTTFTLSMFTTGITGSPVCEAEPIILRVL